MSDNFFNRWSRRKQGLETTDPHRAEGAVTSASPVTTPLVPDEQALAAAVQKPTGTATSQQSQESALPTLADVQDLTPSSDFQAFMRQGVPGEVRNAAMKKLFADPHFNVMDGLDIYIGDYTQADPLPSGMLEKMVGAELLNLFPAKTPADVTQTVVADDQENPEQSPAAPEGSPLVAQSPPSPTTSAWQTSSGLQATDPLEHEHPDLQLQPNHAPASPSSGPSTG
jgi:hypothetical protein